MPVNGVSLPFNRQAEQDKQAMSLQELLGGQIRQNSQNVAEQNLQQIRGQQQQEQIKQHGDQARQTQEAQQQQAGKFYQNAMGAASPEEGLRKAVQSGAMVHGPNGEAIGADPYAKQQVAGQKQDSDAYKVAYNTYNKGLDKQIDQVQKMDKLMQNLNNPSAISGGIAKTEIIGALGMNRYNQQEAASIFGPTATGLYSKVLNAMGGSEGSLSPAQVQATKNAVLDMYASAKDAHEAKRGNALDMYKGNPAANPQTYQRLDANLGNSFHKYADSFEKKYIQPQQSAMGGQQQIQAPQMQPQQPQGLADRLSSWLKGSQQPQQVDPQDAAAKQWLQANPSHPAAAGVAAKLKAKGVL